MTEAAEALDRGLVLVVNGTPGPQGSKSVRGRTKAGRVILVESSKKVGPWREAVSVAARALVAPWGHDWQPVDAPLRVRMVFTLRRPQRPLFVCGAPCQATRCPGHPAVYPDLSKLARSTEDALTGIIWADDSRVIDYDRLAKVYVGSSDPEALSQSGVLITVRRA